MFLLADLGSQVPPDLWRDYHFTIITFDLTGEGAAFNSAWPFVLDCMTQDSKRCVGHLVMVGTKWDLIPSDPYDNALLVHARARTAACRHPGLRMFPVSSVTASGLSDLADYIGELPHSSDRTPVPNAYTYPAVSVCEPSNPYQVSLSAFHNQLCRLCMWTLDVIADIVALPVPTNVNQSVRFNYAT